MAKDFDAVNAELKGPMLIEASAGTGKTYSLMLLIPRLLVENEIPV
ncbi:UvrD-helicase domain-containing protein, partial [uncultured Parasutterella sp.]